MDTKIYTLKKVVHQGYINSPRLEVKRKTKYEKKNFLACINNLLFKAAFKVSACLLIK